MRLKTETTALFEQGVDKYLSRDFADSADIFHEIVHRNLGDKTAKIYAERASLRREKGAPEDWDGVEKMKEK